MTEKAPKVAIFMGSGSDLPVMSAAADLLFQFDIPYTIKIVSAHRTPELVTKYVKQLENSVVAFICGAGMAAHLAGVVASKTTVPVLGVPLASGSLQGQDALLSTVQMPPGIPVATFGIGKAGAKNAALFAISMLALHTYPSLILKLDEYRKEMAEGVVEVNKDQGFM